MRVAEPGVRCSGAGEAGLVYRRKCAAFGVLASWCAPTCSGIPVCWTRLHRNARRPGRWIRERSHLFLSHMRGSFIKRPKLDSCSLSLREHCFWWFKSSLDYCPNRGSPPGRCCRQGDVYSNRPSSLSRWQDFRDNLLARKLAPYRRVTTLHAPISNMAPRAFR